MFTRGFHLGTILGFPVRIDYSWFIIAVLITWTLADYSLPSLVEQIHLFSGTEGADPSRLAYWFLGVVGSLLFFASVLGHELSHAVVARGFGVEMRGITLFVFGGVAEMTEEPPSAGAEFQVAIAGPVASLLFSFFFAGGGWLLATLGSPVELTATAVYLGVVNGMLAVFNLIPAFPLDGGRVLRSVLWYLWGDLRRATRISSSLGSMIGLAMILFGIVGVFAGNVFALWWALIGLFVRNAAQMSYQQVLLRRVLEGEPVSRFMEPDPVTVPRHISVEELVESYIYKYHFKMFPVVDGDRLVGCVTTRQVKELPREEWDRTSVGVLARDCSPDNSVPPDCDAMVALGAMSRSGLSRLMVVDAGRLVGILSLKDLLDFFSLKIELETR